jgi:hypothetical protein
MARALRLKDILKDNISSGDLLADFALHRDGAKTDSLEIPTPERKDIQIFGK